jgi:ubiquinone/menaquinone biosynthesis C-methylase UbiE
MPSYIHGYTPRETQRLREQSLILEKLLHGGIVFQPGSRVLEPGCGVGAQTVLMAKRHPHVSITSFDMCADSLEQARVAIGLEGLGNVEFRQCDLMDMPFDEGSFDYVFLNFVLEHVPNPAHALEQLKRMLKPGGALILNEGDHGSCFWHPETAASRSAWQALIASQQRMGHHPLIGRRLHPLLQGTGFQVKKVEPRFVYADGSHPELLDGVVNKIIVPMTKTAREMSLGFDLIDEETFDRGIAELEQSGNPPSGAFFYSWFRGTGKKSKIR